jgi:ABC-type amino acid transport system permease subunit
MEDNKTSYMVVAVVSVMIVVAVVWLLTLNANNGRQNSGIQNNVPSGDAVGESASFSADVQGLVETDLSADFLELEQLEQELDAVDLSEDEIAI